MTELNNVIISEAGKFNVIQRLSSILVQNESFYLMDLDDVLKKHENWLYHFPNIKPYYAVKCNDLSIFLRLLASFGINFDCSSKGDIEKVLALGVEPSRIVFANPVKMVSHLIFAQRAGVNLMTFDSEDELHKIKEIHPSARLMLRFKSDSKDAELLLGSKFGCTMEEGRRLLDLTSELGLNLIGVAFHVGSGCRSPNAYKLALIQAKQLMAYAKYVGLRPHIVDIGGGFFGSADFDLSESAKFIKKELNDQFGDSDLTVIAEPGRYFVSSAFSLATKIISAKYPKDLNEHIHYTVADGIFGSFSTAVYDNCYVKVKSMKDDGDELKSIVTGMSGLKEDKLVNSWLLPKLKLGDWLIFPELGDYSIPLFVKIQEKPKMYILASNSLLFLHCFFSVISLDEPSRQSCGNGSTTTNNGMNSYKDKNKNTLMAQKDRVMGLNSLIEFPDETVKPTR